MKRKQLDKNEGFMSYGVWRQMDSWQIDADIFFSFLDKELSVFLIFASILSSEQRLIVHIYFQWVNPHQHGVFEQIVILSS